MSLYQVSLYRGLTVVDICGTVAGGYSVHSSTAFAVLEPGHSCTVSGTTASFGLKQTHNLRSANFHNSYVNKNLETNKEKCDALFH